MPANPIWHRVLLTLFVFSILAYYLTSYFLPRRLSTTFDGISELPHKFRAPYRNLWADLDDVEVDDVLDFLFRTPNELNLTREENATAYDNHIAIIEVLPPNKTDVMQYLKGGVEEPARWARLIINQGATEQAVIAQYMIGPLPTSPSTHILPLIYLHNSGRNYVRNPLPNYLDVIAWFSDLAAEISDIINDLLGEVVNPGNLPGVPPLLVLGRLAASEDSTVSTWASINSPGLRFDAWSLLEQGLFCRFDITGRDYKNWKIQEWLYDGIAYNSTEAFRAAWSSPEFQKLRPNVDGEWTASEPSEEGLEGRKMHAPIMIQPFSPRYRIDEKARFVSWMGFEFYISSMQATALSLWNIKFRGESIIYELGLQEAMAHYAGDDPMTIGMIWLDTLFGMGFNMYELVPGYDCPPYATYMPVSFHQGEKTVVRNNSICIFEYTSDYPIQRHSGPTHVTVSLNTYLVVRSVSTVGNYDYTIDYLFYLDGTMEVKVRASGYIFGAYHPLRRRKTTEKPNSRSESYPRYDYGYQIHDLVLSSMHDHVISFRADFDIAGTSNSLHRVAIERYSHEYPWDNSPRQTMRLQHYLVKTETGLSWPQNAGEMFLIMNNDTENKWGEKRGYRITPGTGMGNPPHLTMEEGSTALGKAGGWATKDLWILKQKDEERRGASEYNAMEPADPLVDFSKMVNDEGVVQEDLVVYFNLGSHHIPHSGDIPNTLMHTSASSVMFVPHNFGDRDLSRDSAQGVKLEFRTKPGESGAKVTRFGPEWRSDLVVNKESLEPDLGKYNAPDDGMLGLGRNGTLASL